MQARILVPLDGSPVAEAILPAAVNLARLTGGTLTLLRVVPPPQPLDPFGIIPAAALMWNGLPAALNVARHYLDAIAEQVRDADDHTGVRGAVPILIEALPGDPAATLVDYVTQRPSIRWIAMATHGRSGVARWLYGSVAEHVLQTVRTPLLLLHPRSPDPAGSAGAPPGAAWRHIVVPLDGSVGAEQALPHAQALAAVSGATLDLVTAFPPGGEVPPVSTYLETIARQLRAEGRTVHIHLRGGEPARVIEQVAQAVRAGLIVMTAPARGVAPQAHPGSVVMQTIRRARQPVLLVRATGPGAGCLTRPLVGNRAGLPT